MKEDEAAASEAQESVAPAPPEPQAKAEAPEAVAEAVAEAATAASAATPTEATPAEASAATPTDAAASKVTKQAAAKPKKPRKAVAEIEPARPKADCIAAHRKHPSDVGSTDVQIALLTDRILHLTAHLKIHPKDKHTNYGLRKMVSRRKRLLNYLERTDAVAFTKLKASLNLR